MESGDNWDHTLLWRTQQLVSEPVQVCEDQSDSSDCRKSIGHGDLFVEERRRRLFDRSGNKCVVFIGGYQWTLVGYLLAHLCDCESGHLRLCDHPLRSLDFVIAHRAARIVVNTVPASDHVNHWASL